MLYEVDIDFRIPGLQYSVVTRSTTKQSLEPVQYDAQENDSGRWQRRVVSSVRDGL